MYGAVQNQKPSRKSTKICQISCRDFCYLIFAYFVPVVVFSAVLYLRTMEIAYWNDSVSILLCVIILLLLMALTVKIPASEYCKVFFMCLCQCRNGCSGELLPKPRFRLAGFIFWMSLFGWTVAFTMGTWNFQANFEPYYDITSLSTYPNVDPSVYQGQQFMDAGQIEFISGSHVDVSKSQAFKNGHTYCVAPIVAPKFKGNKTKMDNYDFWAVGLNCCSSHAHDFHCGEYLNPKARRGLRLMRDADRNFYRLAVKQAKAAFNIKANYPIFLEWMEDPGGEIQAHYDRGMFDFINSIVAFKLIALVGVIWLAMSLDEEDQSPDVCEA